MSWGHKILLAFTGFAGLIGFLVYSCMQHNFELVSKNYYNDEIAYQQLIDGSNNASKISTVHISQAGNAITILMPAELNGKIIKGEVWFYCPDNAANDLRLPLHVNVNGKIDIPLSMLAKTSYQVRINCTANDERFYYIQVLTIK